MTSERPEDCWKDGKITPDYNFDTHFFVLFMNLI